VLLLFGTAQAAEETDRRVVLAPPAAEWPFTFPFPIEFPSEPSVFLVRDLHEAFVNYQTGGTRLVTTQPGYWMVALQEAIGDADVLVKATADPAVLEQHAPEILHRAGIFKNIVIVDAPGEPSAVDAREAPSVANAPIAPGLPAALRTPDSRERLALCVEALNQARTPGALIAAASACMEVNDLDAAARDLDEALRQAPDWAALHYERGKVWLRQDEMEAASRSFRAAADRLPQFGPAWSNLGATLGELDRPTEALSAFTRALAVDPASPQTHNNIGVLNRELGNLNDSEAAFRRVLELAPELAFGYYNLGHTLFLQGRYQAALGAYAEGQKRDPERNAVQASRLAMCRLATGDANGAIAELQRATAALPREYRQQLLADTQSIAWALLTHRPDVPGWHHVHDWLARQLAQ
jgi:tetratricopeptide (TPR) repeat protein